MKLTGRQEHFLSRFLELYREVRKPLHYTDVAEVIGVAKITAYDMLRNLEERGLIRSEYVLRGKGKGPGRSTVVSVPTPEALALMPDTEGRAWDLAEWERVKTEILSGLRQPSEYHKLLEEISSSLSERTTPLVYAAQVATAVILNMLLIEDDKTASALVERLRALGLPDDVGLDALGGLTVGLSFVERANRRVTEKLLSATRGYQQALEGLGGEGRRHLSSFIREVMHVVSA
jgi:hypothetical protein